MLEQVERRTATETQAALFARSMGGEVEVPDPAEIRERFDALLRAVPVGVGVPDTREAVLREAFGLSTGR